MLNELQHKEAVLTSRDDLVNDKSNMLVAELTPTSVTTHTTTQ